MESITALESAEAWANIVTGAIIAGLLVLGGIAAFWKFFLQQPLGNNWRIHITPCKMRRAGDIWAYFITLEVQNASAAGQRMNGWWCQVKFPDEVPRGYNPNASLDVLSKERAVNYYGRASLIDSFPLAPGERYSDHMCEFRTDSPKEFCYVEYTLQYRAWKWKGWKWLKIRWRASEFMSQIMTSPVERDDLRAAQ